MTAKLSEPTTPVTRNVMTIEGKPFLTWKTHGNSATQVDSTRCYSVVPTNGGWGAYLLRGSYADLLSLEPTEEGAKGRCQAHRNADPKAIHRARVKASMAAYDPSKDARRAR